LTIRFAHHDEAGAREPEQSGAVPVLPNPSAVPGSKPLLGLLYRRPEIVVGVLVLALVAATTFLLAVPQRYAATSEILIDPRGATDFAAPDASDRESAVVDGQVELLGSPAFASRMVEQLELDQDPEFAFTSFGRWWASLFGSDEPPEVAMDAVVERFHRHLSAGRRGHSYVIEVGFTSQDADKAARIANAVVDAYLGDPATSDPGETSDGSAWRTRRVDALRQAVREAEQNLAAFKAQRTDTATEEESSAPDPNQDQIDALNGNLAQARTSAAEAMAHYYRMRRLAALPVDPDLLADALGPDMLVELRGEYAELMSREAEYSLTYLDGHPRMRTLHAQLAEVRSQIKQEIGRILADARNAHEAARARVRALEENRKPQQPETAETDAPISDLQALERAVETSRKRLARFVQDPSETGVQPSPEAPDAHILSRAPTPVDANRPGALIVLLLAAAGGLGMGMAGAAFADANDSSFRTRAELETALGVPCFGLCPRLAPGDVLEADQSRGDGWLSHVLNRLPGRRGGVAEVLSRFVVVQPSSPFSEAVCETLRRLKTGGETDAGRACTVLAVSSTGRNEGKSVIAANIAGASAQSDALTLLVDADPRSGVLSSLLVPDAECGLGDVLDGSVLLEDAVSLDAETGLYMLPLVRGERHAQPESPLDKASLERFLDAHRDIFDLIVIDTPPLLEEGTCSPVFGLADRALLVVEWGRTPRETVTAALDCLQPHRSKIAGALLNKVDAKRYPLYERDSS